MQDIRKIVTVETFNDSISANIMRSKLEAAGIECTLFDENIVIVNPLYTQAVGGIKLKVREEDLEQARAVLSQTMNPENAEADEGAACPYCGSKNTIVAMGHSNVFAATWALFLQSFPFYSKQRYLCNSCKRYFKQKAE